MAKQHWNTEDFNNNGGFLTYENKFVARFKYQKSAVNDFKKFLIANFSPNEYFVLLEKESPLTVLESKGYVLPHIRTWLIKAGLPATQEGYENFKKQNIRIDKVS